MADAWTQSTDPTTNLGMGGNPFLGQANPYLQQNIDAASADMVNNYNLTTQPAFNRAMVSSGSFGNEGVAQMNADAQNTLQKNLGNLSNTARMQDYTQQQGMYQWQQNLLNQQSQFGQQFGEGQRQYNQNFDESQRQWNLGFDRNVYNDAYTQNMNNLQVGMGLLGSMNQYGQQDLTNANAQQNTPLNYYSQFANLANGMGQGFGTSTGTGTQGTTTNGMANMMGGAQLGSALQNYGNQQGWWGNNQAAWTPTQTSYGSTPSGANYLSGGTSL